MIAPLLPIAAMHDDRDIESLAKQCASNFGLGEVTKIIPITPSFRNQSFQVSTDRGLFLLRLHHPTKTHDDLLREEQVVNHARQDGVPVAESLGTFFQAGRWVSVEKWVSGKTLSAFTLTPELAYRAGKLLASIHLALMDFVPREIHPDPHRAIEDRLADQFVAGGEKARVACALLAQAKWLNGDRPTIERLLDLSARLQPSRGIILSNPRRPHYLHGDFNPRNVIVADPRWTVLDWEDTFLGTPYFDIAKALLYLCGFPEGDPRHPLTCGFLSGYQSWLPLSSHDLAGVFWQARFVIAPDVNWLLVSLLHRDSRRLSFLQRDCERLERLLALEASGWFNPSNIHAFQERLDGYPNN